MKTIILNNFEIGKDKLTVLAGPCAIESKEICAKVCEKLKENSRTRDIPIIFISAYDEPGDIVKGFEIGCEDYIVKPFIPEVVKARVETIIKNGMNVLIL